MAKPVIYLKDLRFFDIFTRGCFVNLQYSVVVHHFGKVFWLKTEMSLLI